MVAIVQSSLPATQKALKVQQRNQVKVAEGAVVPVVGPSEVLVRVVFVGINPVDGKSVDMQPTPGATCGTDFSGVVVALGAAVSSDQWQIGDHVMGGIFGNNPLRLENGAFAEYAACPAQLLWHVPCSMDLGTAASLPAALATVGLALFLHLEIPMPDPATAGFPPATTAKTSQPTYVLVYGGGTATGAIAIQVLRLLGLTPITTCSPAWAPRALALGAAATFDYHSPACGAEILQHTSESLGLVLDCITDSASMAICYKAIGPHGGRYVGLDPLPLRGHTRRSVKPDWVCGYTQFGHRIEWAPPYDLDERPENRACAEAWYLLAQRLLDAGLIKPHPIELQPGGLDAVGEAMVRVREGQIKGRKLVCHVSSS
ncbi:hypothetical protein ACN47E_008475 [Coniothyrium glycines]